MAKLTRAQRQALEHALHNVERAHKYIMRDDVAVARRERAPGTTLSYTRDVPFDVAEVLRVPDGPAALTEVEREYGSDLTGLRQAIETLKTLLALDDEARARS